MPRSRQPAALLLILALAAGGAAAKRPPINFNSPTIQRTAAYMAEVDAGIKPTLAALGPDYEQTATGAYSEPSWSFPEGGGRRGAGVAAAAAAVAAAADAASPRPTSPATTLTSPQPRLALTLNKHTHTHNPSKTPTTPHHIKQQPKTTTGVYTCVGLAEVAALIRNDNTRTRTFTVTLACSGTGAASGATGTFDCAANGGVSAVFTSDRKLTINVNGDTTGRTPTCVNGVRPIITGGPAVDPGEALPLLAFGSEYANTSSNEPSLWSSYNVRNVILNGAGVRPGMVIAQAGRSSISNVNIINTVNTYEAAALLIVDATVSYKGLKAKSGEPLDSGLSIVAGARVTGYNSTELSFAGSGGAIAIQSVTASTNFDGQYLFVSGNSIDTYGAGFFVRKWFEGAMSVKFLNSKFYANNATGTCAVGLAVRSDGYVDSTPNRDDTAYTYKDVPGARLTIEITPVSRSSAVFVDNMDTNPVGGSYKWILCNVRDKFTQKFVAPFNDTSYETVSMPSKFPPTVKAAELTLFSGLGFTDNSDIIVDSIWGKNQ